MNAKKPQKPAPVPKTLPDKLKPAFYLLMMAYVVVPVFVPHFNTFDSNGPKFLALAILNLIAFIVLILDTDFRKNSEIQTSFFRSFTGIAYTIFLVISLLSFFNALNLVESLLNFIKTVTVFASAYTLYAIFRSNRRYLDHLAIALTILLLFDSMTVFYNMFLYISREVSSIMDIKTVYSHKNILASAMFVKIPAALYLIFFYQGWKKWLGYVAVLCAILATLLLSTRAFYIGLVLLLTAIFLYVMIRYLAAGKKGYLLTIVRWAGLLILAVLLYTAAQRFVFPKNTDTIWNTGIVSRLSSIKTDESSIHARLGNWERSMQLVRDHPILGVGTGNWKIAVLEYENKLSPDFIYGYKNHNDFLEITAETGLPGGLAFISIFILILYCFIRASLKPGPDEGQVKLLFLPAFGILAYSVDAFFNFPADRPEIQVLFAIFVALAIAYSTFEIPGKQATSNNSWLRKYHHDKLVVATILIVLLGCGWILSLNVKSLYYQRLARADAKAGTYTHPSSFFLEGFPFVPTVNCFGEPIAVEKALYLLNENRFRETIDLLKSTNSSPYDSRREYYLSSAYLQAGMPDSALNWTIKAYELKRYNVDYVIALSRWFYAKGNPKLAMIIVRKFLKKVKTEPDAWTLASNELWDQGRKYYAIQTLDSALKYLPGDTSILKMRSGMRMSVMPLPTKP